MRVLKGCEKGRWWAVVDDFCSNVIMGTFEKLYNMERPVLIKGLKDIFADINKENKRYTRVWLTDMDYGGLYHSGDYILCAIAAPHIRSFSPEISYLIDLLAEKLGQEKFSYINKVVVYLANERFENSDRDDIIIYSDELVSQAA